MQAHRLLNHTILIEAVTQDGPPDGMGDPTELSTWSSFPGYVWQTSTSEVGANGVVVTEQWELALHRSAADTVHHGDRIIANGTLTDGEPVVGVGEQYEIEGEPWVARNPRTKAIEYVHARLRRSTV